MKKYDLQLFAEAVQGKRLVYLYRVMSKAATTAGATLAFTTENERTKSKDADTTETKDGSIRTPGASEMEITATSLLTVGDTLIEALEAAMDKNELIEIWEANLMESAVGGSNKFKGIYFQGYITELSKSSPSDSFVEVSLTFGINGSGVAGEVTVTPTQQEQANYVFKDTTKVSA